MIFDSILSITSSATWFVSSSVSTTESSASISRPGLIDFKIEIRSVGLGYVYANSLEEAKELISSGDYDDVYDEEGREYGDIISILEGEEE